MTHDPMCLMAVFCPKSWEPEMCICDVIAKVRADMLAKCIATVEELFTVDRWAGLYLAVNALRDLQEKP